MCVAPRSTLPEVICHYTMLFLVWLGGSLSIPQVRPLHGLDDAAASGKTARRSLGGDAENTAVDHREGATGTRPQGIEISRSTVQTEGFFHACPSILL